MYKILSLRFNLKCKILPQGLGFKVNPHRASAAMLALPLPLKYIVTLGNGGEGGGERWIPKRHNVFTGGAAADTRCV